MRCYVTPCGQTDVGSLQKTLLAFSRDGDVRSGDDEPDGGGNADNNERGAGVLTLIMLIVLAATSSTLMVTKIRN